MTLLRPVVCHENRKPRNQDSSAQSLETIRSHVASRYSRKLIDARSALRLRGGFRCFFSHSSASVHVSQIAYSTQSSWRSVVSPGPPTHRTHGAAAHGPSFFAPARHSSLVRDAVAVGCTYPRAHRGILKACTRFAYTCFRYRNSSQLYARRCFVRLICVHCRRNGGSPHSFPLSVGQ